MRLLILATLFLTSFGTAEEKPKTRYIPIPCMADLRILDWGKCTQSNEVVDCPATHMTFKIGCTSVKDDGRHSGTERVQYPTAVYVEPK